MKNKKYNYFEGFQNIASLANMAAVFLNESLKNYNYELFKLRVDEMHKIENQADSLKHEMVKALSHEFITVIEREDIMALSQELDNIIDSVDDVIRRIYMFNINKIRPETLEFTSLIVQATVSVQNVVEEFKHFKKSNEITKNIIKVNSIENNGDSLQFKYVRNLYAEDNDAKTVFVWTMIFEALEQCFDACEHAVDIIESVVMKNT